MRFLTATWALLLSSGAGLAAPADLPKAETILDKYASATGGVAAHQKHHIDFSSGTVEVVGTGVSGTILSYHAEPNFSYTEMNFPVIGKLRQGCDGNVVWSLTQAEGAKIKEGDDRAQHLLLGRFNSEIHWRELYKRVETVGTENVDGKPAYIVVMTPKQGKPMTEFFDVRTGLLVKVILKEPAAAGEARVELSLGDYRKEGGVVAPHQLTQASGGNQFIIRIDTYKYDEEPPKGTFDLPAEVQALLTKQ